MEAVENLFAAKAKSNQKTMANLLPLAATISTQPTLQTLSRQFLAVPTVLPGHDLSAGHIPPAANGPILYTQKPPVGSAATADSPYSVPHGQDVTHGRLPIVT